MQLGHNENEEQKRDTEDRNLHAVKRYQEEQVQASEIGRREPINHAKEESLASKLMARDCCAKHFLQEVK